jgi:hypothetical protein
MRAKRTLLIALLSVLPMLAFSVGSTTETEKIHYWKSIYDVIKFQSFKKPERMIYVTGLWDGLKAAELIVNTPTTHHFWFKDLIDKRLTNYQLESIISKYLSDHPEKWHEPLKALCIKAFQDAWQKVQSQNQ